MPAACVSSSTHCRSRVQTRIADALGVAETSTRPLDEAIAVALSRVRLLVLDNFEHVLPAAIDVVRMLEAVPRVKVLATSREPLHLPASTSSASLHWLFQKAREGTAWRSYRRFRQSTCLSRGPEPWIHHSR